MLYNISTTVPTSQQLLELAKAGIDARKYMELVSKGIDAELEVIRLNSAEEAAKADAQRVSKLRTLYGMSFDAPADLVEQYAQLNDLPDSKLFPSFSAERQRLENEEAAHAMREASGYPDLPDSIFLSAVNAARKHGIPLENVKISIHIVDEEDDEFGLDGLKSPLGLIGAIASAIGRSKT